MKPISLKNVKTREVKIDKYTVTALTRGGEEIMRTKIDPNKRHSKNNTIVGWNVYENEMLKTTLYQ